VLEGVELLLHAGFHPGLEDRVTQFPARGLHQEHGGRAAVRLGERDDVQRRFGVGHRLGLGRLDDLGRHDPLVGHDLAVLAVEGNLEAAVGDHDIASAAADPQVDLGDRHLAALSGPVRER